MAGMGDKHGRGLEEGDTVRLGNGMELKEALFLAEFPLYEGRNLFFFAFLGLRRPACSSSAQWMFAK